MNNNANKEWITTFALHIILWGILIGFPWLFYSGEFPSGNRVYLRIWIPLFFAIILFYINYFLLIPKLLFNRKFLWFALANIALLILSVYGFDWIRDQFFASGGRGFRGGRGMTAGRNLMLSSNLFLWVLAIGLSTAERVTRKWLRVENARKALETEQLNSQLTLLNYQLQPHFFFNALNTIYALVDEAPEKAKLAIHSLSKLMRYLLNEAQVLKIPMKDEVDFIQKYIDLMELRSGHKLQIHSEFYDGPLNPDVPPLLLIPLVENAFKHGASARQDTVISFKLEMDEKHLTFTTRNSIGKASGMDQSVSGIGLENLRKRLSLLFKEDFSLEHYSHEGYYYATLKFPI